ncbi:MULTISPECIES: cold-shock protein [Chryseobacterium]|uniref:Cold-shock DNA-binding protein family n=2 Tax=Chryseobacterium TaxID=59732 RepID=A0A1M5HNT6_9FLAO|nr:MULTISPECIES: cold-shock protein [Chryseobacterium]PJJ66385.1 CspA family cold shock protein [Chryseobacterium geocarposphaerae]SHG17624.1 cold-shock DNA-binding protein family [Chryseobacterium arachidis]
MQQGTVKFFNEAKGFGFISPADGSKDIFVHSSGLVSGSIRENDKVNFNIQQGDRGLNAVNVKLA